MNSKILIGVLVAVVLIGGVILLAQNQAGNKGANSSKTPQTYDTTKTSQQTPTETAAPTATATGAATEKTAGSTTITLTSSGFEPKTVTVKTGTKVVWINKSGDVATVNSAVHPTHLVYPALNLGQFADGESLSLVFKEAGTFKYHDHLNPSRNGIVIVE